MRDNATENLRVELKSLADTLGEVLSPSGNKSKGEVNRIRSKAEHALRKSHHRLGETSDVIAKQTRETMAETGNHMRRSPRAGVGVGAVVGVVLSVLPSHR